ncbi:MAG: HAMP domain-containing protein [Deltaproteobacteria bacterium]|nr:HAMP domain-containing protein [Deltaproteobacteria bacterium]
MRIVPWRSLRLRLIVLLVLSVVCVLAAATALEIRLSTRLAERNLQERALTLAKEIDILLGSLWGRTDLRNFHHRLAELARTHRNVADIEILLPVRDQWRLLGSSGRATPTEPIALDRLAMELDQPIWQLLPGSSHLGLAVAPFHLGQRVIGAIRVKASLAEVERLANVQAQRALLLALLSVLAIAGVLGIILTRTIARPVGLLVDAMNAARAGRLDTRVQLRGSDELQQLGDHFNSMLETIARGDHEKRELVSRLSRFNDELESRVATATADIAAKNLELQRSNEQLWHVQKQLGRAERLAALGQMTAAIAHELGTPLNSVLGYTQLLAKEVTSEGGREKLSIIESQVRIMSQAIRNALDQTRTPSVERRPVAVVPLIEETLALLAPALNAKGIAVERQIDTAPATISADPRGLQQILLNILTNAVDALDPNGHIRVRAEPFVANGGPPGLRLRITDDGTGIAPHDLQHVFQPFFTTKEVGRGTGLGLTITQDITRAHGGTIRVDSEPGRGTTVDVTIAGGVAA